MLAVYNSATICINHQPHRCGLRLQPDLTHIMSTSRNWDELQHVWTEWRRNTGQHIRNSFEQMVHLSNEASRLNSKSNLFNIQRIMVWIVFRNENGNYSR